MEILENNNTWSRFRLPEVWWTNHEDIPYFNEPFNDPESLSWWRSLGYTQTKFTGDMYDMRFEEPKWMDRFREFFPWNHFSWSIYRMTPGCTLPRHSDLYVRFRKLYNIEDPSKIRRAVVFLDDWQSGHYFDVDDTPVLQWRAGEGVVWENDTPHSAANVGVTNRYTLQITGAVD